MLDPLQFYCQVLCNGMKMRFRMVMIAHPGPGIGFHKRFMWQIIIPPTTAVLWVDHAFDSLKVISAYKGDQAPGVLHTNHKSTNFNKRVNPAMPAKNASTQAGPHTPNNPKSNSTSTKPYNNYSNNRYSNSGSTQKNYSFNNYKKDDKATDAKLPNISSKLPYTRGQPSNDKAGNPICYKCGKIGFARDCPKHPYKARIFTLGINGELIEADTALQDHQAEGGGEISPELDPTGANDIPDGDGVEDQYVDDAYDPTHFEIVDEEDETPETQDESASFNMLSFIKDSEDDYVLKLATVT